jgi:hypothetical protein
MHNVRVNVRRISKQTHLIDGKVGLDRVHWRSWPLLLGEDVSTLPVESRVDTSKSGLGALDLAARRKREGQRDVPSGDGIKGETHIM